MEQWKDQGLCGGYRRESSEILSCYILARLKDDRDAKGVHRQSTALAIQAPFIHMDFLCYYDFVDEPMKGESLTSSFCRVQAK